jgi:hypothetical protein
MTPKQTSLYWREWAAVRAAQPDADRHDLHHQALGAPKSSKEFTNRDLDLVLGVFRAISDPGSLKPQLRQENQERARLEHRLSEITQCLGVYVEDPAGYVAQVVQDRCSVPAGGTLGIDDLSHHPRVVRGRDGELIEKPSQLLMLVMTLWARLNALRRGRHHSLADMYAAAGIPPRKRRTGTDTQSRSPKHRGRGSHTESGAALALASTDGSPGPEEEAPPF